MTYNLKKDYLKNWDLQQANEKKAMIIIENDDDQDIYISERSSVASSNEMNQTLNSFGKRLPTPATSSTLSIPQKQPHTLQYPYNELSENGTPSPTPFQFQRKEENKKKKDHRKTIPGQGSLAPFRKTKPSNLGDHYYPQYYQSKLKNPDRMMRYRQTDDDQVIPYESLDPSQCAHQPALITSSIKPRQQPRKTRNQDKQRLDHSENNPTIPTYLTSHENHENNYQKQKPSPRQSIHSKDSDHDEHRIQPSKRTISQQQHRKLKTENDRTDNYVQSLLNGKPPQDSNNLMITSNALTNRTKNRPKIPDKNFVTTDIDENGKHRHQHHPPHRYHHQNQTQSHNSPSIPSQQPYHPHPYQHHIRRHPPSGTYLGSEFPLVDVTFKKPNRPSYLQQARESYPSPVPPIYNRTPYFPPIIRDHHQHKINTPRFPTEYYGTLARQAHGKHWEEPMDIPKIYKPNPQTRFYDRYLHNIVDKRLAA